MIVMLCCTTCHFSFALGTLKLNSESTSVGDDGGAWGDVLFLLEN